MGLIVFGSFDYVIIITPSLTISIRPLLGYRCPSHGEINSQWEPQWAQCAQCAQSKLVITSDRVSEEILSSQSSGVYNSHKKSLLFP